MLTFPFLPLPDIDECASGTHECGADFVCINTAGSYRCVTEEGCGDGFIQNAASSCIGKLGVAHASENLKKCFFLMVFLSN